MCMSSYRIKNDAPQWILMHILRFDVHLCVSIHAFIMQYPQISIEMHEWKQLLTDILFLV